MKFVSFGVIAVAICPGVAFAQQAPSSTEATPEQGVLVYGPEFFGSTALATALEMVQRLPGFTPDYGNSDARGLAGNSGNILIDGRPPASKTDSLGVVLRRISAASVARIELIRGGAPGIDMQGRAVVANVVLKRTEATEKLIDFQTYVYRDGYVGPDVTAQYTHRNGDAREELSVELVTDRTAGTAQGTRTRTDASGGLYQLHDLDLWDRYRNANARGSIQRRAGGGLLRVNARVDYTNLNSSQTVTLLAGSGSDGRAEDVTHDWAGELGANWTRPLGEKSEIELIALQRLGHESYDSSTVSGGFISTFGSQSTNGESIVRSILRHKIDRHWSVEGGGEIAYNFLRSDTAYAEENQLVALPNNQVFVNELRGEMFGQASWTPSPRLTVEAGLRTEVSRIASNGDFDRRRSFFYPKPRVQLTWRPSKKDQLRLRLERTVSQLDFDDFVASTEINLGTVIGGNGNLVPQRTLTLEAVYEHRFWNIGAIELGVSHEATSDVIDYIPLEDGYDAVGNIGDGTRDTASGKLTLPFDKIGIKDARLRVSAAVTRSRVTDPLTGERRRYSDEVPFTCNVTFSHDLSGGRFTYGIDHSCNADRSHLYRIAEYRTTDIEPVLTLFGQWKPSKKLTVRADLGNAINAARIYDRDVYTGPRNTAPLLYRERRVQRRGQYLYLQVRRAF
ncbi:TonB-dependent receptor plug domain-containing protein [Sphingomonas sp. RS6]